MFETINPFVMPMSSALKIVQHVYQKSAHGEIIFYSSRDAIVFFTLWCVCARKYGIRPTMLCIMVDHTHGLYPAGDRRELAPFIQECYSRFSWEFNEDCGRRGKLFKANFGCARKFGDKSIRSINAYVANNPVEKKECLRAEEYQWNFLAYARSDHPFSKKLVIRNSRSVMRRTVNEVQALRRRDVPINYRLYDRLFEKLNGEEKHQLIDYIISMYNVLDYGTLLSFYKSYEGMLEAFVNTKGAEYDLNEEYDSYSNRNYQRISEYLEKYCGIEKTKDVIHLPEEKRLALAGILVRKAGFPHYQVRKYLHLPLK